MKFTAFMQSLLPGFEKDRIVEDIRLTKTELHDTTLPAYKVSEDLFKSWNYKSKEVQEMSVIFKRIVSGAGKNIIMSVYEGLKNVDDNLDVASELIVKTYSEEVAAGGMTYLKANLLQYVEMSSFVVKYSRKFLIYVYVLESSMFEQNSLELKESLTPKDMQWIDDHFINFCNAFAVVTNQKVKTTKAFSDIPDIVITGDNEDTLVRTHAAKIDPFSMRLIPIWLNPIYHVRMFIAEWQANRYKAAVEELKMLQLRKLHLERLNQGKNDAALEKEIAYYEGRCQTLNYKIHSIEEQNK